MATEAARFKSDLKKMVEARMKIGMIIAAVAEQPEKFQSSTGNYEIRNPYEVCKAVSMSPTFFRKVFKNRYKKIGKQVFVEFTEAEILSAKDALETARKTVSKARTDSEARIFSLVVSSIVESSTNNSFYGLE